MIAESPVRTAQPAQDHAADAWDEMFDVVNSENMVIGQQRRDVVHKQGLLHRSVHVMCCRPNDGSILLQRRSLEKALEPGCWDLSCAEHLG
eukprot:17688-Heterococcus_DN1.PRE.3